MRRINKKDLKRRVVQARKVCLDENSSGMYISYREEFVQAMLERGNCRLSCPGEDGFAWARSVQRVHQICAQARCFRPSEKLLNL